MFKVLIVDDEETICKGLSALIDWRAIGFEVIDYALDGFEALMKIESGKYDVIITDIRMPEVDGIELIKRLRSLKYPALFIILSGYKDFEYAKAAVEYGARHYLLKPVDEKELINILNEIRLEIEEKQKENIVVKESKTIVKEKILMNLMISGKNNFTAYKKAEEHGMCIAGTEFQVCIIKIDEYEESGCKIGYLAIRDSVEDLVKKYYADFIFQIEVYKIGILFCYNKDTTNAVKPVTSELLNSLIELSKAVVTLAVGSIVTDYKNIPCSYDEACNILECRFFIGRNKVISSKDLNMFRNYKASNASINIEELCESIKNCDKVTIKREVSLMLSRVPPITYSVHYTYNLVTSIFLRLIEIINNIGGSIYDVFGNECSIESYEKISTVYGIKDFLIGACIKVADYISCIKNNSSNKNIEMIIKYVKDHCTDDISLKSISREFYVNPVYLGRLFKNATEMRFVDFVNDYRIEYASGLLSKSELMVCEISEKVGYKDINYFYKVFKAKKRITPAEYRRKNIEKKNSPEISHKTIDII